MFHDWCVRYYHCLGPQSLTKLAGGILTATPMALVSDLASSTKRLKQAADHPLWSSYVLPFVLGMALTLYYEGQDPLDAYKS